MAQNISQEVLNKVWVTDQVNNSSLIAMTTGSAIIDVRGRAVTLDANGNVNLSAAGDAPFGIGIITNDVNVASGAYVDIQYKNIGLVYAGGAITKGAKLACGADGAIVAASGNAPVIGVALEAAGAAGVWIKAVINGAGNGYTAS